MPRPPDKQKRRPGQGSGVSDLTKQEGFARNHGLPIEGVMGGKATLYPEYESVIRRQLQQMATGRPASTN